MYPIRRQSLFRPESGQTHHGWLTFVKPTNRTSEYTCGFQHGHEAAS
jgi:hypothetical protein